MNFNKAIVLVQLLTTSYGDFELACDTANPSVQTDVTCVCRRTVGSGIKWFFNGNLISDCYLNSDCLPQPINYTFSINVSESAYEITKSAYDYNDCTQINCTDVSDINAQLMVVPSAINFDPSNPTPISEPTVSHSNGNISITTGCISGYTDVTCEWYTVYNGVQEKYTIGQPAFDTYDKSACLNCNDDVNAKKTCGFYHIEASGNETKNVNFRVVLTHTPTNLKWEVNSANVYTVKVNKPSESDRSSDHTLCIVLGCLGFIVIVLTIIVVVHFCTRPKFSKIELYETEIYFEWTSRQKCCYQKCYIDCKPKQPQLTTEFTKQNHFTLERLDSMTPYEISLSRACCCLSTKRSVITRKSGMPNDQVYDAKSTTIDVRWNEPDCITNPNLKYKVTCNEKVKKKKHDQTNITIKDLIPGEMNKIEVFAIDKGTNKLLLAKEILTTHINVKLEDVRYEPETSSVKCHIKWRVENFDIPETFNPSDNFLFNVICRKEEEHVHIKEIIRNSGYIITDLNPDCSYSVDVYAIYKSRPLEPHAKIELRPYKPTNLDYTATSTEIEFNWKRPEYVGDQQLEYEVTCNEEKGKTTKETSFKLENLKPRQQYDIKIFTIINGMKSRPLQEKIRTIRPQPSPPIASHSNRNNQHESFPEVPIGKVHLVAK